MIKDNVLRCCKLSFYFFHDPNGNGRFQIFDGEVDELYFSLVNRNITIDRFYINTCYKFNYAHGIWITNTDAHVIAFEDPKMRNLRFPSIDTYFYTEAEFRSIQLFKLL